MSEIDKKWLIKSDNVILGPYAKSEVKQLISDALVSINDEITEPCTFWWSIQDHPEFKNFAKSINLQTRITNLITGMGSRLTTTGKTDKHRQATQTFTDTASAEEADFKPLKTEQALQLPTEKAQTESPSADFQSKLEIQREVAQKTQKIIKRLWHLVILISLGVLSYIAYREIFVPSQKKVETLVNVREIGMKAYREGNELEAFKHLNTGWKKNLLSDKEKVALASLLLKKRKAEKASEVINSLSASYFSKIEVLNLQGLLHLLEKNLQVAESFFLNAYEIRKKSDDTPTRSLINLALLNYIRGDTAKVEKFVNQLMSLGYERGFLYYLKILNSLAPSFKKEEQSEKAKDIPADKIKKDILFFMKIDAEYRQEFYVLLAWLNRKDKDTREDYIRKALNEDPYFIEEYSYDLFTGNRLLDWSYLMPYCKDLFREDTESALSNSFYAFCHIRSGKKKEAEVYLETAKKQAADNPLIASIYSYNLMENGKMEEAESTLEIIQDNNNEFPYTIPYILKARIYTLKQEWPLAILAFQTLLSINSGHISGLGGMAYASFQTGNNKDYLTYKERALRMYPHYKKLLTLKNKSSL